EGPARPGRRIVAHAEQRAARLQQPARLLAHRERLRQVLDRLEARDEAEAALVEHAALERQFADRVVDAGRRARPRSRRRLEPDDAGEPELEQPLEERSVPGADVERADAVWQARKEPPDDVRVRGGRTPRLLARVEGRVAVLPRPPVPPPPAAR